MTTPVDVRDSDKGYSVHVNEDGALLIEVEPSPSLDTPNHLEPFTAFFTVNGDGTSASLSVNGSVTPVEAWVSSVPDGDLYITGANVLIADGGTIALNRFGGIAGGLTNGCDLFYESGRGRQIVATGLKTNFSFIRLGSLSAATGGKTDAYQMSNVDAANNDGYNPVLDLTRVSPQGIRLRQDSFERLGIVINDDLSGVATFNIFITGFKRRDD